MDSGDSFVMMNFIIYALYHTLLGKQMKNNYMDEACSTRGNDDKLYFESMKGRGNFEYSGVDKDRLCGLLV
jgi:hypothetical protein